MAPTTTQPRRSGADCASRSEESYGWATERIVALQLLGTAGGQRLTRSELAAELSDIAGDEIADALTSLAEAGVAIIEGEQVWASSATRRLDHLDLICV